MSHSEPNTDAEEEEEREIQLADPDDYHRRQRLKEIHKSRQRVHKVIEDFDDGGSRSVAERQRRQLAYAVSMYVSELEPIILDLDADISLPEHFPYDNILEYADSLGIIPSDVDLGPEREHMDYTPKTNSIQVYRVCNRVLADVKPLITDDDSDEWEV